MVDVSVTDKASTGCAAQMKASYFNWLVEKVCNNAIYSTDFVNEYEILLERLHSVEFRYSIANDDNRAIDGIALRDKYAYDMQIEDYTALSGPCSFLEMLIALALRCENDIMGLTDSEDRTPLWFWSMITNCGLINYDNSEYDERAVEVIFDRILDRKYTKNGTGGLFRTRNLKAITDFGLEPDFRKIELWYQLSFWLQENFYFLDDDSINENVILG